MAKAISRVVFDAPVDLAAGIKEAASKADMTMTAWLILTLTKAIEQAQAEKGGQGK